MTIRHVRRGTMRPVDDPAPCDECARLRERLRRVLDGDDIEAENERLRAFVAAWDLLEDIHGATIMATRDEYNAAVLALRDTRAALDEAAPGGSA